MPTPLQVLILEDRLADADLVVRELKKAGFEPDWQRVDQARDFQMRLTPNLDVILADYTVPGFGALDALHMLREQQSDVPVIIVSGSVGDDKAVETLKLGATDYVLKDRLARLGPAVHRALDERRHRAEKRRADDAFRRSDEQLRSILSTVEDVVWSLSLVTGRLLYLNPAAEKLMDRPLQEILDDPQSWLAGVHPEDLPTMSKAQEQAIKWGTFEGEFRLVRPDTTIRDVLVRAWTAYGPEGNPMRLEGLFTDITDRRSAEREHAERTRFEQLSEFRSQMLNMVAHDLNNVLSSLKTGAYLLTDAPNTSASDREMAKGIVRHSLERMAAFLADLLDTARLQSGELTITKASTDLAALVKNVVDAMSAQAVKRGIRLDARTPARLVVSVDPRRIEQVLTNLLGNSLKFTPKGGTVSIGVHDRANHVSVTVEDDGKGIAKEDLPRLFQPFARLAGGPQEKHTGTGLGLYICRGIVEGHGGTIEIESAGLGKGSMFKVRLNKADDA
jgi:hypothetical protein